MIELKQVGRVFSFQKQRLEALNNLSIQIEQGEFIAITGGSGSGKSTLLSILGCMDKPSWGQYYLLGQEIGPLKDHQLANLRASVFGCVFQAFLLVPEMTVLQNVMLPMRYGPLEKKIWERQARKLLDEVGLAEKAQVYPAQLSGGQQQRVAIARALANDPQIILADEPTGNLDMVLRDQIFALLNEQHQRGKTLILVTHDSQLAGKARREIRLEQGKLLFDRHNHPENILPVY